MRRVNYLQNPTDETVRLMIYKSDEGVYVFGFDDLADTSSKWDHLYDNLDGALEFCQDTYHVDSEKWIDIDDPRTNCQHDWMSRPEIGLHELTCKQDEKIRKNSSGTRGYHCGVFAGRYDLS